MPTNEQNINANRQGVRDTGFPEPLSAERNTTLPHKDAQTAPNEKLDTNIIADKSHNHQEQAEAEMYSGLVIQDNPDDGKPKDGAIKKVVNKLSCGTV